MLSHSEYDIRTYADNAADLRQNKKSCKNLISILGGIIVIIIISPILPGYHKQFTYTQTCKSYKDTCSMTKCLDTANLEKGCLDVYCYNNIYQECLKLKDCQNYDILCNNQLTKEFMKEQWEKKYKMSYVERLYSSIFIQSRYTIEGKNIGLFPILGYIMIISGIYSKYKKKFNEYQNKHLLL